MTPLEIARLRRDLDAYSAENQMLKEQAEERSNATDTYIRVVENQKKMLADSRAQVARLVEALAKALHQATEYIDGCLYCGDGEIVDGTTTPEHQADCWWYRARALLADITKEQKG